MEDYSRWWEWEEKMKSQARVALGLQVDIESDGMFVEGGRSGALPRSDRIIKSLLKAVAPGRCRVVIGSSSSFNLAVPENNEVG